MKKRYVIVILFALLAAPLMFLLSCGEDLMLDVPDEMSNYDFDSGEEPVTVSDLPTFTGTAVTQADLDNIGDPDSEMYTTLHTIFSTVVGALDPGSADRAINAYWSEMVTIEDEDITVEGLTINVANAAESVSVAGGWDGDLSDFVDMESFPEDLFAAIGAVDGSLVVNLDFDVEASTDASVWEGPPIKSAVWHHTSLLSLVTNDVEIEPLDGEGVDFNMSGTLDVKVVFKTSVGVTVSGDESGMNGRYILEVELEEIDEEGISLGDWKDDLEAAIEDEDAEAVYDVIGEYYFPGTDQYLTITISAYDNNDVLIGSAEFDPFAFMFLNSGY